MAILLVAAPISISTGCKSPHTAQQLAIKSLETTWQAVHSARLVYAKAYRNGDVSPETHQAALNADQQFRDAFEQALVAAGQDWSSVTPSKVAVAAEAFLTIVFNITKTQ